MTRLSCKKELIKEENFQCPFEGQIKGAHPNNDSSGFISSSDLKIRAFGDMVEKELKEVFGFFIFTSNNSAGETLIHV